VALNAAAPGGAAQRAEDITPAINHVVMITTREGDNSPEIGAGFVVGASESSVFIATARHVVGRRLEPVGRCDVPVFVSFAWERERERQATRTECSNVRDIAGIEVPLSELERRGRLPGLSAAAPAIYAGGHYVWIVGHPRGRPWVTNPHNSILLPELATSDDFVISSIQLEQGYSGGGVVGQQGSTLLGIVRRVEGSQSFVVRWSKAREDFEGWKFSTDLIKDEPGSVNPAFLQAARDPTEETARGALRRYVRALEERDAAELERARLDLPRSELFSLIGDARKITTTLRRCTSVEFSSVDRGKLNCEHEMTVQRRTGDDSKIPPVTVTIDLQRAGTGWSIARISKSETPTKP
jgi:hypothetical protein